MTAGDVGTPWTGADSSDLMDSRRCRATSKRSGQRCKRFPVPGGTVCVMHGGAAPQAREAARRRRVQQEATRLLELIWDESAEPVTDPVAAMQQLAGRLQHSANILGAHLDSGDLDGPAAVAWTKVLRELRLVLEGMERLGIADRAVQVEAEKIRLMAAAFSEAIAAIGLPDRAKTWATAAFLALLRGEEMPERSWALSAEVISGELE